MTLVIIVVVLGGLLWRGCAHTPPLASVAGRCTLTGQPLLKMRRNETTGRFYIDAESNTSDTADNSSTWINRTTTTGKKNETQTRTRSRRTTVTEAFSLMDDRALQQVNATWVRNCPCLEQRDTSFYCEVDKDLCQITKGGRRICYTGSIQQVIGNFIPFYGFWVIFLIVMLVMTPQGRYAWSFVRRKLLVRSTVEEDLDRIILRQPEQILYMRRTSELRMRLSDGGGGRGNQLAPASGQQQPQPVEGTTPGGEPPHRQLQHHARLRLRTKLYHDANANSEEQSCTICLGALQDGMRVGSLSCHHDFHVDCLKTWLKRKNHCPLCNEQAAEVTFVSSRASSVVRRDR